MTTATILIVLALTGTSMVIWGLGSILVRGFSSRRMGVMLLLAGMVVVVNVSLYVRDTYWEDGSSRPAAVRSVAEEEPRGELLGRPEAVCRLLADHGFTPEVQEESGRIWGQVTPMYYSCQASRAVPAGQTEALLTYRVQSDHGNRVDLIRLQAELLGTRRETAVLEEFKQLAAVLFGRLPVSMPDGLGAAVEEGDFGEFDREAGTVELLRDRYENGYRLRLEIRPDSRRP